MCMFAYDCDLPLSELTELIKTEYERALATLIRCLSINTYKNMVIKPIKGKLSIVNVKSKQGLLYWVRAHKRMQE